MNPQSPELESCIYEGVVTHRRHTEFDHQFRYRLFQVYLDLNELDTVFQRSWLWSLRHFAPAEFRRTDHFGDPEISLQESVRALISTQTGISPNGPIRLLTNLRCYGFQMNPVSFFFCFDEAGERVEFFVAEVCNTPWGEQHCYVFEWPGSQDKLKQFANLKEFHVSPFLPMDMEYRWRVSAPEESLNIQISNYRSGELAFDAGLHMRRSELSAWNMNMMLMKYPFMTMKVFRGIYWQALKLWWKGATYHEHPKNLNQHKEISS